MKRITRTRATRNITVSIYGRAIRTRRINNTGASYRAYNQWHNTPVLNVCWCGKATFKRDTTSHWFTHVD